MANGSELALRTIEESGGKLGTGLIPVLTPEERPAAGRAAEVRPASIDRRYSVEVVDGIEAFSGLEKEWDSLAQRFATPLLSHNWFSSCARAFCRDGSLKIVLVREFGELKAAAALNFTEEFRRRLTFLGSSITREPGGFLFSDQGPLSRLIEAIIEQDVPVSFKGLRFASPEMKSVEESLRARNLPSLVREENLPWVSTRGRWEDFEKRISSSRRSSLRRLQRLAESKGKLEFEAAAPLPGEVDALLEQFFEVEASSWKGRIGTALKSYGELGRFFRDYSSREAGARNLRLFFLRIGGRTVAGQLTVVHANRLWIFKVGHDESWSWCSPGILLMHRVLRHCFETGLEACEFLGSDESWLHIWGEEYHRVVTYRIFPALMGVALDLGSDVARGFQYRVGKILAKKRREKCSKSSGTG